MSDDRLLLAHSLCRCYFFVKNLIAFYPCPFPSKQSFFVSFYQSSTIRAVKIPIYRNSFKLSATCFTEQMRNLIYLHQKEPFPCFHHGFIFIFCETSLDKSKTVDNFLWRTEAKKKDRPQHCLFFLVGFTVLIALVVLIIGILIFCIPLIVVRIVITIIVLGIIGIIISGIISTGFFIIVTVALL